MSLSSNLFQRPIVLIHISIVKPQLPNPGPGKHMLVFSTPDSMIHTRPEMMVGGWYTDIL